MITAAERPNRIQHLAANTIRGLAMDGVQKANSGHPGLPMGMADVAVVLWSGYLRFNPADPGWPNRDRFVLSAGHGSMLLYSLLHLTGYELSIADLQDFRQWDSITPGHPESHMTPGVETTTGPLGQGLSNAVGMALAERWLAEHFNRPGHNIIDHHTYVIASDGDLMEGISHEAFALAGHLGLGKLIVLYDDNHITIDGPTSLSYSDDVAKRFQAYGWQTLEVDGHDHLAIDLAISQARTEDQRPTIIACRTHIGYGSPGKQDTAAAHGEPLGEAEIVKTKENLGWPTEPSFLAPEEVLEFMRKAAAGGALAQDSWNSAIEAYRANHPELVKEFLSAVAGQLPDGWSSSMPSFETGKALASRASSGQVLSALSANIPTLIGGSADLTGSNLTLPKGVKPISRDDFSGRYIHFGIREHGMGGILNGMTLHGGLRVYGGTFLIFSDYMRPTIRLAAIMGIPVIYVFTHDSIGLGEDGPTHQPVEQLMSLRTIPNLTVFRPADAGETSVAWQVALESTSSPAALVLTRQGLPTLDRTEFGPAEEASRGAYILSDVAAPEVLLIGTGSEVHIALAARQLLAEKEVPARVISMPSWELFESQSEQYKQSIFPDDVRARVSVEAGVTLGWERYVGREGASIGLDRFGASAPYQTIYQKLGITAEAVVGAALRQLG